MKMRLKQDGRGGKRLRPARYTKGLQEGYIRSSDLALKIRHHLDRCGVVLVQRHKQKFRVTIERITP